MPEKASELAAIPVLLERLGADDGLRGALVTIDAIATNTAIAEAITAQGADYLLAVKANQPTLRAEVEAAFAEAADPIETHIDIEKGHGRIEQRRMSVLRETDWLAGDRRFPGELRLPGAACLLRAQTTVETRSTTRTETRYFIALRVLTAPDAATAVREHWAIENRLRLRCSTSFSATTSPACARATAPETWPPSDTSPSTSCEPTAKKAPSSPDENGPDGRLHTSNESSHHQTHELDSEPCRTACSPCDPGRSRLCRWRGAGRAKLRFVPDGLRKGVV